ncbi:hypothetical protein KAI78_06010 [bacterium]|nr:hypothetical protein [bacterium]
MKRIALFLLIITAFISCRVYVRHVPPKPKLMFYSAPEIIVVPGFTAVYYVKGHPSVAFFFDGRWFILDQGYWYASQFWKGPWVHVKKGLPPGLLKARKFMANKAKARIKTGKKAKENKKDSAKDKIKKKKGKKGKGKDKDKD